MATYWTKNSGDILLTLQEQTTIAPFLLPLSEPNATVKIISLIIVYVFVDAFALVP